LPELPNDELLVIVPPMMFMLSMTMRIMAARIANKQVKLPALEENTPICHKLIQVGQPFGAGCEMGASLRGFSRR
jgi:hypothetical protein